MCRLRLIPDRSRSVAASKTYEIGLEIFDMIPSAKFKLKSRANFTELIRLRAKFGDFGIYLRSNFDAGLVVRR
jgi:hypothetical protein